MRSRIQLRHLPSKHSQVRENQEVGYARSMRDDGPWSLRGRETEDVKGRKSED